MTDFSRHFSKHNHQQARKYAQKLAKEEHVKTALIEELDENCLYRIGYSVYCDPSPALGFALQGNNLLAEVFKPFKPS